MQEIRNKVKKHNVIKLLFRISFLYYIVWIIQLMVWGIFGVSEEYVGIHIESLCDHIHTTLYGIEAISNGLVNFIVYTFFYFWYIPLFQIIYIIVKIIIKIKNKIKK